MSKPNLSRFDPMATSFAPSNSQPQQHSKILFHHSGLLANQQQTLFLEQQGFTVGLIKALSTCNQLFPKRCWILDNSVQMTVKDSHRISGTFDNIQDLKVTRWEELQDCVSYQVQMASTMQMPTRFALLNNPGPNVGPQYFSIGETGSAGLANEVQIAGSVMARTRPFGVTPLSNQLAGLHHYISSISQQLIANKHIVPIVIATQGLPTDDRGESSHEAKQQFVNTLSSFRGLPVCVLFRICTDDERVFEFYNSIDTWETSLRFDVIDDFFGESLEVHLQNPWLTYALPLHRFRELGFYKGVLDAVDERKLTPNELREFCSFLFGSPLPDPKINWNAFYSSVANLVGNEKQQWNPVAHQLTPWVNLLMLQRMYENCGSSSVPEPKRFSNHISNGGQGVGRSQQSKSEQQHFTQSPNMQYQNIHPYPQPQKSQTSPPSASSVTSPTSDTDLDTASLKKKILVGWALIPPQYQTVKSLPELLGTIDMVFPDHGYFEKWKTLSLEALAEGEYAVIKRANRKIKFLLHPDKLPRDLSAQQLFVSELLWAILADAWESWEKKASA